MNKIIEALSSFWLKNDTLSRHEFALIETQLTYPLPNCFSEFFFWSNGGRAVFDKIYMDLWPIQDFTSLNEGYLINHYLGDEFLAFGSDGGPICFLLDFRIQEQVSISSVNFGDLDINEVKVIASSFQDFLTKALNGSLDSRNL